MFADSFVILIGSSCYFSLFFCRHECRSFVKYSRLFIVLFHLRKTLHYLCLRKTVVLFLFVYVTLRGPLNVSTYFFSTMCKLLFVLHGIELVHYLTLSYVNRNCKLYKRGSSLSRISCVMEKHSISCC